jgi:alkylation response protein AidB-like acyl-CoA dehydrogenase
VTTAGSGLFARLVEDHQLTAEERALLGQVRELVRQRIEPRAERLDAGGVFPWESIRDLNAIGLNGVFIPAEHGGAGLSYRCFLWLVHEISRGCPSTGVTWATNYHATGPVIDFGSPEQKERFLPVILGGGLGALAITEQSGGSDATAMRTRFRSEGQEIVVSGDKVFITSGDVADLYLVFGKWSELGDGKAALSVLVVEKGTPGLFVVRKEDKLGHRASSTVTLRFDECRVPRANLLCGPGDGRRILLRALNKSRPSVAAQALGIARAAFDDAAMYVNQREQFGQRIVDFQGIQFALADLATRLLAAEALMLHVAGLIDAGEPDVGLEASALKLLASDLAVDAAGQDVQFHGGYGYVRPSKAERLFRDAKLTQIWEGANELHRATIGRAFSERRA